MKLVKDLMGSKPRKRPSYLVTMRCLDCCLIWDASRSGAACPRCASGTTLPAGNWNPVKYGMPILNGRRGA